MTTTRSPAAARREFSQRSATEELIRVVERNEMKYGTLVNFIRIARNDANVYYYAESTSTRRRRRRGTRNAFRIRASPLARAALSSSLSLSGSGEE